MINFLQKKKAQQIKYCPTNICLACLTNHRLHTYKQEENLNKIWADHLPESVESCITIY